MTSKMSSIPTIDVGHGSFWHQNSKLEGCLFKNVLVSFVELDEGEFPYANFIKFILKPSASTGTRDDGPAFLTRFLNMRATHEPYISKFRIIRDTSWTWSHRLATSIYIYAPLSRFNISPLFDPSIINDNTYNTPSKTYTIDNKVLEGSICDACLFEGCVDCRFKSPRIPLSCLNRLKQSTSLELVKDLNTINDALDCPTNVLYYHAFNANTMYSDFWIDKDTKEYLFEVTPAMLSTRRLRHISAPKPSLKRIQRSILTNILSKLDYHSCNAAFIKGSSIKKAVDRHLNSNIIIRMDVEDFFPSHSFHYVKTRLKELLQISDRCAWLLASTCCKNGSLPQGAPTSPMLSIVLNYELDKRIFELARQFGFRYMRYSDDLIFSAETDKSNELVGDFLAKVRKIMNKGGFKMHKRKTLVMRQKACKHQIGIKVDNAEAIDPSYLEENGLSYNALKQTIITTGGEPIPTEVLGALLNVGTTPIWYYAATIPKILGLHLDNANEVKIPGYKYKRLRVEAMLYGKGLLNDTEQMSFRGKLAYVTHLDPHKSSKLKEVIAKHRTA